MALYQKYMLQGDGTICVKSFMVLWKSAKYFGSAAILLSISPLHVSRISLKHFLQWNR